MAHTPGPWKWRINRSNKRVYLNARGYTVMDFVRYGMSSAAPRFRDNENLMVRAEEIASDIPGYNHHNKWDQDLNHDDARLIAAAPELLEACKEAMTTIDAMLGVIGDFADPWGTDHKKEWLEFCNCFDKLGEAVTKAEGR